MNCANTNCLDRSETSPLFACFGPCGNYFHAKCVGSSNAFLDKVNKSTIAFWYCPNCIKISLAHFSFKLSTLKNDIAKISKGFEDLSLNFSNIVSTVKTIPTPPLLVDKSCETDDIPQPQKENGNKNKKRGRDTATSSANIGPAPKKSLFNNTLKDSSTGAAQINKSVANSESSSVANNANHIISLSPSDNTNNHNPVPEQSTLNVTNAPSKSLGTVPKPKVIFVSRLLPETEPADILEHLVASKVINNSSSVKCTKISKPNSFVASFKITAPSTLFEPICNSSWPPNTLVKEFTAPLNRKSKSKLISSLNSKNCTGSPSTTKT